MTPEERGLAREYWYDIPRIKRDLIDAHFMEKILEEREACAKIAEELEHSSFLYEQRDKDNVPGSIELKKNAYNACKIIVQAIRGRK